MAMAVHQIACHPKRFLFNLSAIESSFKRKQQEKGDQKEERNRSKRKTTLKALRYSNMSDKLIVWKIVNVIEIYSQLIRI